MKFLELIANRQNNVFEEKIPTVAFLGDSVTDGCFELRMEKDNRISPIYDKEHVYHQYLLKILNTLYPTVSINVVNAGINGTDAGLGNERLEKDVLSHHPDLTVVCFGLNDVHRGIDKISLYREKLTSIFQRLKTSGSEVIFMTPNMMNTSMSSELTNERLIKDAGACMEYQTNGVFDAYLEAGKKAAREQGVVICDVYAKWKTMQKYGVKITGLLCNHINHPTRELHWLFAYSLMETLMAD